MLCAVLHWLAYAVGVIVGLLVVGFVAGYARAWEIATPQQAIVEDEDG